MAEWRPNRILEDLAWKFVDLIVALQARILARWNEDD